MVSRPLQIARVGERTFSITRLKGSSCPLARSPSRRAITSSNLEKRSTPSAVPSLMIGSLLLSLELCDCIDELAEIFDICLLVHADDDVIFILNCRDKIHHRQ